MEVLAATDRLKEKYAGDRKKVHHCRPQKGYDYDYDYDCSFVILIPLYSI